MEAAVDERETDERPERERVPPHAQERVPPHARERVPVATLVDLERLAADGRPLTPARLRAALPRGWVLEDDGVHARRDLRLLFREGWILAVGLVSFGAAVLGLFWWSFPRGVAGILRFALVIVVVLVAGGLVAPIVTRALNRRT
jgi:hypothetical protein